MIEVIEVIKKVARSIFLSFFFIFLGKNSLYYSGGDAWRAIDVLGKYCPPS